MLRRFVLAAAALAVVPLAGMLAPAAANAAASAACTGAVAVTQFAFSPPSVPVTSSSALTLGLQNCTSQAITGSTDWYGYYLDANGNRALNCGIFGPVVVSYSIAAGGTYSLTNNYGGPPAGSLCQPASLQISTTVNVGATSVTNASAYLEFAPACNGGVAINQFYYNPETVNAGDTSTLTLVLQNCTNQTITGSTIWAGRFTASTTGIPPGCPAIDPPPPSPYSIAPGGTFTQTEQEGDTIAGCQATGLTETVNVSVNGVTGTAATASANLAIVPPASPPPPPPGGCHVTYQPNNWGGGFTANVTISNTGTSPMSNWTLTFTFPGDQKITSAWNATYSQTGESVSLTNVGYNATIPPGGSQTAGFQGTWTSSDASPASFSVNGAACS